MAVIKITIDGKSIATEDVPFAVYRDIEQETGIPWTDVWGAPLSNATAGVLFLEAVAQILGVELPPLTPKVIMGICTRDDEAESRPEAYEDGLPAVFPGIPLEESVQPTD
jgi:hypothetical protein